MDKESNQELGRFIQQRRHERGWSLRTVAERADVSKSFLSDLENALAPLPSLTLMRRIARALDVDEADLLQAAGHLPEVIAYMRAKYGLPEPTAEEVEDFVSFMRQREHERGGRDEPPTDTQRAA